MDDRVDFRSLVDHCRERGITISLAESCTGGYISSRITDVPGSSACFMGSVVAYSNDVKRSILGVSEDTLSASGAVSRETALEMAHGCRKVFGTSVSMALTGIAGPSPGDGTKPVGRVFIAVSSEGKEPICEGFSLGDMGRSRFKVEAARRALGMLMGMARSMDPR